MLIKLFCGLQKIAIQLMQKSQIKPVRLSASLILDHSSQHHRKILMLNRKPNMSFANSLVFPGGVCEPSDEKHAQSHNFINFAKITAIRQTLEETGILVLPSKINSEYLFELRGLYSLKEFSKIGQKISKQWLLNLNHLIPIARFITPQIPKMSRFDCIFYLLSNSCEKYNLGSSGSLDSLDIQKQESNQYYWKQPEEYLQMHLSKQVYLPPPQNIILSTLTKLDKLRTYSQTLSIVSIEPLLGQFSKYGQFLLPGDKEYDHSIYQIAQPKSRNKEEICKYLTEMKQKSPNNQRKIINIYPQTQEQNRYIEVHCSLKQETLLKFLTVKIRSKL